MPGLDSVDVPPCLVNGSGSRAHSFVVTIGIAAIELHDRSSGRTENGRPIELRVAARVDELHAALLCLVYYTKIA